VTMAHVVHAKVDAGLVGGRPYHQMHHGFRDVDMASLSLSSLLGYFSLICLVMSSVIVTTTIPNSVYRVLTLYISVTLHLYIVILITNSVNCHVSIFYLSEVLGDSVLSSILILSLFDR
jgi:hypothetical protein